MRYLVLFLTVNCVLPTFAQGQTETPNVPGMNSNGLNMAFYSSDSLNKYYTFLVEQDSIMKRKQAKFEYEVQSRQLQIQSKYERYERERHAMLLTGFELQQLEQELEFLAKGLEDFQNNDGLQLQKEAMEIQAFLQMKVNGYAKSFCEKNNLDVLLMNSPEGQFTYLNPKLDVTRLFIDYVNNEEAKSGK